MQKDMPSKVAAAAAPDGGVAGAGGQAAVPGHGAPSGQADRWGERLPRQIGLLNAIAVLVGVTIGSGIFRVPATVAAQLHDPGPVILCWILGGLIAVFGALALSPEVFLKLIGVGLATAVLVDATIARMVLVPAVMQLLGHRTWWIPRWLDRLIPRAQLEAPATA